MRLTGICSIRRPTTSSPTNGRPSTVLSCTSFSPHRAPFSFHYTPLMCLSFPPFLFPLRCFSLIVSLSSLSLFLFSFPSSKMDSEDDTRTLYIRKKNWLCAIMKIKHFQKKRVALYEKSDLAFIQTMILNLYMNCYFSLLFFTHTTDLLSQSPLLHCFSIPLSWPFSPFVCAVFSFPLPPLPSFLRVLALRSLFICREWNINHIS